MTTLSCDTPPETDHLDAPSEASPRFSYSAGVGRAHGVGGDLLCGTLGGEPVRAGVPIERIVTVRAQLRPIKGADTIVDDPSVASMASALGLAGIEIRTLCRSDLHRQDSAATFPAAAMRAVTHSIGQPIEDRALLAFLAHHGYDLGGVLPGVYPVMESTGLIVGGTPQRSRMALLGAHIQPVGGAGCPVRLSSGRTRVLVDQLADARTPSDLATVASAYAGAVAAALPDSLLARIYGWRSQLGVLGVLARSDGSGGCLIFDPDFDSRNRAARMLGAFASHIGPGCSPGIFLTRAHSPTATGVCL